MWFIFKWIDSMCTDRIEILWFISSDEIWSKTQLVKNWINHFLFIVILYIKKLSKMTSNKIIRLKNI